MRRRDLRALLRHVKGILCSMLHVYYITYTTLYPTIHNTCLFVCVIRYSIPPRYQYSDLTYRRTQRRALNIAPTCVYTCLRYYSLHKYTPHSFFHSTFFPHSRASSYRRAGAAWGFPLHFILSTCCLTDRPTSSATDMSQGLAIDLTRSTTLPDHHQPPKAIPYPTVLNIGLLAAAYIRFTSVVMPTPPVSLFEATF